MHKRLAIIAVVALPLVAVGLWTNLFIAHAHADTHVPVLAQAPTSVPAQPAAVPTPPAPKTIHVLVVPGHEPNVGGASYGSVYERNLTVELGQDLQRYLQADPRFAVTITRDTHAWNPTFADYFKAHGADILAWEKAAHKQMKANIANGTITLPPVAVDHPDASASAALHLFGITKWANENGIDVMVHIHFNDDRATSWSPRTRSGFAVYEPVPELKNAVPSHALATVVFTHLAAFNPVSDLAGENGGIIDDSQLIALGQDDTADPASILVEYDYIYERQYGIPALRDLAINDMAYQTYLGLRDFAGETADAGPGTSVLPHVWRTPMSAASADATDVYALQTALIADGDATTGKKPNNTCRRSGRFDACTRAALSQFQNKYDITGENGVAGTKTLEKLNALWGK